MHWNLTLDLSLLCRLTLAEYHEQEEIFKLRLGHLKKVRTNCRKGFWVGSWWFSANNSIFLQKSLLLFDKRFLLLEKDVRGFIILFSKELVLFFTSGNRFCVVTVKISFREHHSFSASYSATNACLVLRSICSRMEDHKGRYQGNEITTTPQKLQASVAFSFLSCQVTSVTANRPLKPLGLLNASSV